MLIQKLKIAVITSLLCLLTTSAYCFNNEPDGFRNAKWNSTLQSVLNSGDYYNQTPAKTQELPYNGKNYTVALMPKNKKLSTVVIPREIQLYFWNNGLDCVWIDLGSGNWSKDVSRYKALKAEMINLYGPCDETMAWQDANNFYTSWTGTKSVIDLRLTKGKNNAISFSLFIKNLEHQKEINAEIAAYEEQHKDVKEKIKASGW